MNIVCPKCHQEYEVDPSMIGQQVQCESCGLNFIAKVPKLSAKREYTEKTLVQTHPCGWYFFWYYFFGVVFLLAFVGIIFVIAGLIKQFCTTYIVTDRRIIVKTGWLSKHQTEVRIKDVRGVALEASIWERIIGTGSIAIGTAATAKAEITMFGVKKPQEVVSKINEMRDDM